MLVLFESPSGYAIFKMLDESKVEAADDLNEIFSTPENAANAVKLKHFKKFEDTTEALAATTAAVEGKLSKSLKKVLKKIVAKDAHERLAVADAKLGQAIKEKMNLTCVYSPATQELMRGIRAHVDSLISGLPERDMTAMALGLAHSLSRYKLKFSPDKVDTMIVQAIYLRIYSKYFTPALLDDLDKELNNYIMRCREWYGWHFPEVGKVVTDHLAFAKVIKKMGVRTNAESCDLSDVLPEEIEKEVVAMAQISMGTEISEEDIMNITYLADQIIEITEYRGQLYDYLKNRMAAIAPNLTLLVGELVGARLIAHAGSLLNLAKHPASTVQILGAEKALFRALKTRKDTPKYGLIYHASLVGQSNPKNKGKISRMLAAKCSLAIRYDALAEESSTEMGIEHRAKLEARLRSMDEGGKGGKTTHRPDKWTNKSELKMYDSAQDFTIPAKKRKIEEIDESLVQEELDTSGLIVSDGNLQTKKKSKKDKKEKEEEATPSKPKKKKIKLEESIEVEESTPKLKKKKKKVKNEDSNGVDTAEETLELESTETPKTKKSKKKQKEAELAGSETKKAKKRKSIKQEE
uniref:nucleolar protein 58 isoform X1 n=1 Tax=Ciona intestinalis TaxID=7719 RepID=UPI000EF4E63D|nr:nucleolar protein 58 isoform X1 [Ciona intestinalis]|eukprot:XP_026695070.1 nucleolar protein 58 isoform X1 [Ciona intestinalis]